MDWTAVGLLDAAGRLLLIGMSLLGIVCGAAFIIDGYWKLKRKRLLGVGFILGGVFLGWYSLLGLLNRLSQV